ncbi:hypothetical protein FA15DRAFT_371696 [Coprinopsis marcescibilis]|uniref:Uncharacterized protein n=1 Tax=Coprinopsis marcescibilis TaxID=230819 RepID=A0A5C3KAX5_COPMA|nr:hypothetical protein FA15DRAFT_371696 [Coprinopsis marcescibilis]
MRFRGSIPASVPNRPAQVVFRITTSNLDRPLWCELKCDHCLDLQFRVISTLNVESSMPNGWAYPFPSL